MSQFKRILIPTDGSPNTRAAIEQGLQIAKLMNSEVTALNVLDAAAFASTSQGYAIPDLYSYLETEGNAAVDEVRKEGERLGVKVSTIVKRGSPAADIIEAAKDYDLIVIGTLGRTGMSRLLMGSVAEKVVRFAPCPVLVVRGKEDSSSI